ncbi:MAG: large conductance mechanosensitive channel protein MscL [Christensenellales bacterium]|jgi:large conductance mechanosensitive channel
MRAHKRSTFIRDFKAFALKGNVIDMAVGVIIGGAFGSIVTSLVNDLFMPVISLVTGKIDFNNLFIALDGNAYPTLQAAKDAGVATLNYGAFLTAVINFLLIALCVFLFIRLIGRLHRKQAEAPKAPARTCPYCMGELDPKATRCPHCTSAVPLEEI